ncbi:MAG TPA: hypothetical protein DCY54_01715 [Parachlamydiales bacterium]|nr:MAG: hypothetical protein A2Z85_00485 [Chlamydiae bacterium GWA2_50_15]OGN63547.1 MAG: hypothetical protein A3E26_02695 [Chlamydiae bacterium RIFCSPHIGHO2_12_FULL_49_32]OGN68347.1 MAG: hypothetical protein A3I15_04150 [Chlamydiae bacterium RIFCSPLOWO2_02_FULL_49_12]OGN73723.1 MAG: hypothetical protein A3G30_05660 [Chlamydiae bacterium RIFCSPLOWO2_12_FULL_49_12]HAZ15351.1 hypothetical protein [Parachlamydiales bacterium]
MVEPLFIALSALFASLLTFFSGFGLGTMLMPVMALFFPLPVAITLTALVHLFHNLCKSCILWKSIHWKVAVRFGGAALLAAVGGAWLLRMLSSLAPLMVYTWGSLRGEVSWIKAAIGLLFFLFATLELLPNHRLTIKNLYWGGAISGFFGGLSGNQGAFRSLFLLQFQLDARGFIGTSAAIAAAVDVVRLLVYGMSFQLLFRKVELSFVAAAFGGAVVGIVLGVFSLRRVTLPLIQRCIILLLYLFGTLLLTGLI